MEIRIKRRNGGKGGREVEGRNETREKGAMNKKSRAQRVG